MKKALPQEFYDNMKNVHEGQIAIPFLTPTANEIFTEERIGDHKYKIGLETSYCVAKVNISIDGVSYEISESYYETDWHLAKLNGYLISMVIPKYK